MESAVERLRRKVYGEQEGSAEPSSAIKRLQDKVYGGAPLSTPKPVVDSSGGAWSRAGKSQTLIPASGSRSGKAEVSGGDLLRGEYFRLENQRRQAQADLDTEAMMDIDSRLKELRESAGKKVLSSDVSGSISGSRPLHKETPASGKSRGRSGSAPFSAGKLAVGGVVKGADDFASRITSSLAWLEKNTVGALLPGAATPFQDINQYFQKTKQANEEYYAPNVEAGGKAAAIADKYGTMTAAAIPNAVLAMMAAPAKAAQTGIQTASAMAQAAPGITNTLRAALLRMGKDPQLWSSFLQTAGSSYEAAKADGTSDLKANLYALGNGLLNAAVEIGGGIETLPTELQAGQGAVKAWIESMVDEGKEEVVQGILERGLQNLIYQKENPVFSIEDESAVLNPRTALEEFKGGAVVGGILGGGQTLLNAAAQRGRYIDLGDGLMIENLQYDPRQESAIPERQDSFTVSRKPVGVENINTAPEVEAANTRLADSDLDTYLQVGVRQHVRNAKDAMISSGDSPILTTTEKVRSFIQDSIVGKIRDTIKAYGKVGTRFQSDVSTKSGGKTDIAGYYLELDSNRMQHLSEHIQDDGDVRNIPLTEKQVLSIPDYIDSYDDVLDVVTKKDGQTRIYLGKQINGHSVIVVLASKGRSSIQPVTAWQNTTEHYLKKYGLNEKMQIDTSQQQAASDPVPRGYKPASFKDSIPQDSGFVKKDPQDTVFNANNGVGPVHNAQSVPSQGPSSMDSTIPQGAKFVNQRDADGAEASQGTEKQPQWRTSSALERAGVTDIAGDMADYRNVEFVRGADQGKRETARNRRQAEARLQPSRGEKLFAKGIADGDYTVEDIPASMERAKVAELADFYAAENSYKGVDGVQERGREIRRKTEVMAEQFFKDEEGYRPIRMLVMNERTPERVMRSIFGQEQGERINEAYIYPVQQNEASKARFIQRQLDEVRTFTDSRGQRSALTKDERAVVQQMLEDRFVGETIASMEMAESIRNAAENIRHGEDPVDAAKEFSLDAEERGLAQQYARWTENQERLTSGELDSVKINNAVEKFAEQYDLFYDAVNDFLAAHGYGTIGFIKGYAPHMQGTDTQNRLLSALRAMGVNADASSLPTSISGLTADYKPGKRWNPHFLSRTGNKTDYDVSKGYESYVSYLGDIFYHTDDIARLRGVSRYLRKTFAPDQINHAIDHAESLRYADLSTQTEVLQDAGKISEGTKLTYQDARNMMEAYIDELYDNVAKTTKYGEFVKYVENYANLLAGKQSMADRGMEYMAGRTSLNAGNKLVAAFGRAQVAGNVSSVLNQSAQLAQILAEVDGKYVAQAAADLTKSTNGKLWNIKKTALFDQSDLLTGKKGIDYLTADDSRLDSLVTAMFKPADIMDGLVSALAVQSKYNQLVAEGKPAEVAMLEADRWATQVMASRMKGSRPLAFESKSVVNQMLHMFQVEALNSWEHISQDLLPRFRAIAAEHGKKAGARAVATVLTRGLLSAFLLNRIAEGVYGGTPAPFDLLGYLANFVASGMGMSTNKMLLNGLKAIVNAGWEKMFGGDLFDEDEEEEDKPFDWKSAGKDLKYNISNDIPLFRNAAGMLGWGDQTMPFYKMKESVTGIKDAALKSGIVSEETGDALLNAGAQFLPLGRQLQKTVQGTKTMLSGGRNYGYGDKQRLQYPVKQRPDKWLQAVLFGNSGLSETRDFYASGENGLSAKQTSTVKLLVSEGADRDAVYKAIQGIRKAEGTSGKLAALSRADDLTDRQRWQLYTNVIANQGTKRPEQFRQMLVKGMTWEEISDAFQEYIRLDEQEGVGATEKATQFAVYLDRSGMSEKHKDLVQNALKFYSQIPANAERYETLTGTGIKPGDAAGLAAAIGALEPERGKTSVSNLQRYRVVVDYGLSETEQVAALKSIMEDSDIEKLETVCNAGLSPRQFVEFREATDRMEADKYLSGKTISGSKKQKILAAIDAMQITNAQKTALYYAAGYKASTLDDAPWYGRAEGIVMPRLADGQMFPKSGGLLRPTASDNIMPKLVP